MKRGQLAHSRTLALQESAEAADRDSKIRGRAANIIQGREGENDARGSGRFPPRHVASGCSQVRSPEGSRFPGLLTEGSPGNTSSRSDGIRPDCIRLPRIRHPWSVPILLITTIRRCPAVTRRGPVVDGWGENLLLSFQITIVPCDVPPRLAGRALCVPRKEAGSDSAPGFERWQALPSQSAVPRETCGMR